VTDRPALVKAGRSAPAVDGRIWGNEQRPIACLGPKFIVPDVLPRCRIVAKIDAIVHSVALPQPYRENR